MAFESLTDEMILRLLKCPKRLTNPNVRTKRKEGHEQTNYNVEALDESGYLFEVYKRQNLREGMENDFSCGINWITSNGETLTLKRYNGPNNSHLNQLEQERLGYSCHIHIATEEYIRKNRKAEGFAEITTRYNTLEGAMHCLVSDCNITGISTSGDNPNQTSLFELK